MKILLKVSLLSFAAFALIGCAPAANTNTVVTNTNTNTNTAPKAAAPTADSLIALETKAFEAWKAKDGTFFEGFLADNFVGFDDKGKRPTRTETVKMLAEDKCEVKSYALSEPRVTAAGPDVAVLTYKATADGTCEGKKIPSPITGATVYVRSGDAWKAAYHNEVAIVETPSTGGNAQNSNTAAAGDMKKETTPAASTDVAKKEAPAANATASNTNSAAPSTGDALTDALVAVEKKGWESWMKQDANGLEETTSKDLTFVDSMGKATIGQSNVIKMWTDGSCKVSSVNVSDGKATMIANNVAILTYKGTAVGTCGTMKIEPLWATSVGVKEGDVWKAVYIFETPAA
ncbi:MAG: DUF4440 domain-containing protein [Blastocatellia bacterium]|nr:DUF4440 domain-containing protein [Blastocatellia bacterium]